jgi:hypothetical protein
VVLAASIGYLGVQYAAEAPIRASQTAEAQKTASSLTMTTPFPTYTPQLAQVAPSAPIPQTSAPAPTIRNPTPALTLRVQDPCPVILLMPGNLDPDHDLAKADESVRQAIFDTQDAGNWPTIGVDLDLWLVPSALENRSWIRLSNSADVTVTVLGDSPQNANGVHIGQCGGEGTIRKFSGISLVRDSQSYTRRISTTEADFFTLQPGEFEVWSTTVACGAPGRYQVSFTAGYNYEDTEGAITAMSKEIVCPQEYSEWAMYGPFEPLLFARTLRWDGTKYEQTGP